MRPGDLVIYERSLRSDLKRSDHKEVMILELSGNRAKVQEIGALRPVWVLQDNLYPKPEVKRGR